MEEEEEPLGDLDDVRLSDQMMEEEGEEGFGSEEMDIEEESKGKAFGSKKQRIAKSTGVDVNQMNKFLDQMEEGGDEEDDFEGLYEGGDDDEDEEGAEEVDEGEEMDEEMEGGEGDIPEGSEIEEGLQDDYEDDDNEDMDEARGRRGRTAEMDEDAEDEMEHGIFEEIREGVLERRKEENQEEEGEGSLRDEDGMDAEEPEMTKPKSKIDQTIDQLESKMMTDKAWNLKGEVVARNRPVNSLLEQHVDFKVNTKAPEIITVTRE